MGWRNANWKREMHIGKEHPISPTHTCYSLLFSLPYTRSNEPTLCGTLQHTAPLCNTLHHTQPTVHTCKQPKLTTSQPICNTLHHTTTRAHMLTAPNIHKSTDTHCPERKGTLCSVGSSVCAGVCACTHTHTHTHTHTPGPQD